MTSNRISEDISKIKEITIAHGKADKRNFVFLRSRLSWVRIQKSVEYFSKFIPVGSKVLELGCGCGHTTAMLAAIRHDLTIIGTDIETSSAWDELSGFGCSFRASDAVSLPFDADEFDAVVSFGVLEHVDDPVKFIKEVNRCLKKDGYNIIFNLPNQYAVSEFMARMLGMSHHNKLYSRPEAIKILKDNGFKVCTVKREHFIPAELHRLGNIIGEAANRICPFLFGLDQLLCKTPLVFISQNFRIVSRKL
jgi:SAM-dependent methyltransferase